MFFKQTKRIIKYCFATLPRKIISILVIAGILLSSAWFLFFKPAPVEAGWWDEDWLYRRAVVITNSTTAETDVFISFDGDTTFINTDSDKFQADCGDLRFTKIDGTQLDYYIDSDCHTSSTVVHVKLDMLQTGDQTIYFYYGNPSADNGFIGTGFSTEASSYSIGVIGEEKKGTGPVLWLKFDEGYGTTAHDSSEQNNDGTLEGDPVWTDSGKFDKALNFDGDGDYVHVGDIDTEVKTVTLWIRPNAVNVTEEPLDLNGDAYVKIIDGTVTGHGFASPTVYVNGIVASTVTTGWNFIAIITGTGIDATDLDVGRLDAVYFNGIIDEVKIYPYARDAEQIKRDYNKGAAARIGRDDSWLTDGLVGYWKMDEDSWVGDANEVEDSSGAGNHGTIGGDPTTTGTAKFGRAGTFDGTGDYVEVSDSDSLDISSQITLSAWVKITAFTNQFAKIIMKSVPDPASDPYELYTLDFGSDKEKPRFIISTGQSGGWYDLVNPTDLSTGSWYHIVGTYDGRTMRLYVNGVVTNTRDVNITIGTNNEVLRIGETTRSGIGGLNGQIDDMRVYNRELSGFEVRRLYDWGPGPVGHWKFDEGSGSDANDSSENANTGTITDATWKNAAECKFGNCLDFDGVDDYVRTTVNSAAGNHTFSMWMKPRVITGYYNTLLADDGTITFGVSSSKIQLIRANTSDKGWSFALTYGSTTLSNNQWYHVVFVADGTGIYGYLNGILDLSDTTYTGNLDSLNSQDIGDYTSNAGEDFDGLIDDVKIYNYARTQKQIVEDMLGGRPGITETTSSPGAMAGYWKFDEGFGIIAYDASGRDNDLDFSSSTESYTMAGKFGKAWDGDGSKYLSHANDADFNFTATEDFSISGWFKHSPITTANDYIIAKHESGGGYKIYMDSDGDIAFAIDDDETWDTADVIGNDQARDYDDNAWHYFAAVKRGTSSMRLYVDGREIDNDTDLAETGTLVNTDLLYVGIDSDHSTGPFDGELDEIKIYRFALSPEEILLDYNKGKSVIMGAVGTELQGAADQKPAFGTSGSQLNTDHPLADGLVGLWLMNENTGTTIADLSGNGNTGIFSGNVAWISGPSGPCLTFPGTDDWIDISDDRLPAFGTNDFTVVAKCKHPRDDTTRVIFSKGRVTANEFSIYKNADDTLRIYGDDGNLYADWGAADSWPDDEWVQIAVTRRGMLVTTYINAIAGGTDSTGIDDLNTTTDWRIGASGTGDLDYAGLIDYINIWNRALSANEIKWLYAEPFAMLNLPTVPSFSQNRAYCPPGHVGLCNPPVAEYKFDEYSGSDAYDTSSNTNNGTITNATWRGAADCKYNSCLDFDGTGDYVSVTTLDSVLSNQTIPFTVNIWFYPIDDSVRDGLWSFNLYNPAVRINATTGLIRFIEDGTLAYTLTWGVTYNSWSNLVITYDTTNYNFYLNGKFKESRVATYDLSELPADYTFSIGRGGNANFSGLIDDVKIFDYALTQEQIAWVYNKGSPIGQWKFDEGEGPITYNSTLNDGGKLPGLRLDTDHSLSNGLVGVWLMNENTGDEVFDLSGNGNTGVVTGDPQWEGGNFGSALDFDADEDRVNCGNDTSLNDLSQLSISMWVYPRSVVGLVALKGTWSPLVGWGINIDTNYRYYFTVSHATTDLIATSAGGALTANAWNHLAVVWSGTTVSADVQFFANGVEVGHLADQNGDGARESDASGSFYMGNANWNTSQFDGLIDNAMIWNRALSAAEIAQLYAEPFVMISDTGASLITGADWSSGRYNSALDFDGDDDGDDNVVTVAIDSDIDLNNKTGYSVCGWIAPDSDGQDSEGEWFSKGNSYIRVDTESGSTVEVSALFDLVGDTDASLNTTQTIPIGSWSHICTTWKNDDDDELTIYINGINAGSSTNGSGAPFDDSDSHLNIGGDDDRNFDGDIDEVTIYNYELTSQQVKLDYNQGSALRFGD